MSNLKDKYDDTSKKYGKGTCGICTVIGIGIPIAMAVMGGLYLNDCPAQHYIPIYLLVAGVVGVVSTTIKVIGNCCQNEEGAVPMPIQCVSGVMATFCLAWFIAGNVWIYSLHNKFSPDPTDTNYCSAHLYLFAFWITTSTYIIMAITIFITCIMFVCSFCCERA